MRTFLLVLAVLCWRTEVCLAQTDQNSDAAVGSPETKESGTTDGPRPSPTAEPPSENSDDSKTAAIIRRLAPGAAAMADADLQKIALSARSPEPTMVVDQRLTLGLLCEKFLSLNPDDYSQRLAELQFPDIPSPYKLMRLLTRPNGRGHNTMLQPEFIQKVTCREVDDHATGTISFDAELYQGAVDYKASNVNGNWRIDEFSFPARGWRFVRQADETWRWFDHFGQITADRKIPTQAISGKITLNGQPLDADRIWFTLLDHPDFTFYAEVAQPGEFTAKLPPGRYRVIVRSNEPKLATDYRSLDTTPLVAEIKESQHELSLPITAP